MTTMSVQTFLKAARSLPVTTSVLLRADHGKGKSDIVRQIGKWWATQVEPESHEFIDRRLSQMSEGDMIGLPIIDGDCTRFNPPDWYKLACDTPCTLHLDELNRATPEVMQAAFQIVLDRELNGYKLHSKTRVFASVNVSAMYVVNSMDPALLDRFFVVDLVPTPEDWLSWARQPNEQKAARTNVHELITDFMAQGERWLDPPANLTDASMVHPSRRSWERVSDALCDANVVEKPSEELFYILSLGFVGTDAAIAFTDFAKNYSWQVTAEDIVDRWSSAIEERLKKQGIESLNGCIEKVSTYVTEKLGAVTDAQSENVAAFMKTLPSELRIVFWSKLSANGTDQLELIKQIHAYSAQHILDVFGVPMGEAGIGVVPKIPGFLQEEKEDKAPAKKKRSRKSKKA